MNNQDAKHDAVVIGAGVSGLVAATELIRHGKSVRCYEARERVGGRALSIEHNGHALDLGATWFWPNEPGGGLADTRTRDRHLRPRHPW